MEGDWQGGDLSVECPGKAGYRMNQGLQLVSLSLTTKLRSGRIYRNLQVRAAGGKIRVGSAAK